MKEETLDRRKLYLSFIFICLTQCAWVFLEALNIDVYGIILSIFNDNVTRITDTGREWSLNSKKVITGSLGHNNLSAALIASLTPFVYKFKKYLATVPVAALFFLNSTMGIISLFIAAVYYFTFNLKHKKQIYIFITALIAALFTYGVKYGGYFSNSNRLSSWGAILKEFGTKSLFFGNGGGFLEQQNFKLPQGSEYFRVEHNEVLTLFIQYGLIGVAVAGFITTLIMRKFIKEKDIILKSSLVALLFNSLGSFPFHIASTGIILIILTSQLNKQRN